MSTKMISTVNAPAAIGPYAQAVKANGFLFISGQIPVDPKTNEVVAADFTTQTIRSMENIKAIAETAGATLQNIVKTTIFVSDLSGFAEVNKAYGNYFTEYKPARACVEVSRLPKDVLVEIEAIIALD